MLKVKGNETCGTPERIPKHSISYHAAKGSAIKGIGEKFDINPVTGTWSLPISMYKRLGRACTTALPLLRFIPVA